MLIRGISIWIEDRLDYSWIGLSISLGDFVDKNKGIHVDLEVLFQFLLIDCLFFRPHVLNRRKHCTSESSHAYSFYLNFLSETWI